ncbi:MAG: hypothetical protein ABGZ53_37020 [Fuerstiella sp.]
MNDDPYKVPESKPEASATIFWSYRSIPELSGLSRADQKAVWKACHRKAYGHWQCWLGVGIVTAIACGTVFIAMIFLMGWLDPGQSMLFVIGYLALQVAGVVFFTLGITHVQIRYTRPYLQTYLNDREADE